MMRVRHTLAVGCLFVATFALGGCQFLGGAAVGAAGTGTAYEIQNKQALEQLEDQFREGRIDRDEYLRRKAEIEDRSAVY
jgi:hypothetical protein